MTKLILLLFSICSLLSAIQIVEVKEGEIAPHWYMKDGRKVFPPYKKPIISPNKKPIISPYKKPVIAVYVEKEEPKDKVLSKEEVQKQFASKEDLKRVEIAPKEGIKIDEEAAQFFESINKKNIKPVNIE